MTDKMTANKAEDPALLVQEAWRTEIDRLEAVLEATIRVLIQVLNNVLPPAIAENISAPKLALVVSLNLYNLLTVITLHSCLSSKFTATKEFEQVLLQLEDGGNYLIRQELEHAQAAINELISSIQQHMQER